MDLLIIGILIAVLIYCLKNNPQLAVGIGFILALYLGLYILAFFIERG